MFRVKAEMSNEFKRHYDEYGHFTINKIYICRKPIHKGVELFLNAFTLGKYSNYKNDLNYDSVFHLYLMILLSNGMWMLLEKNERPVLKPSDYKNVVDYQHMHVFVEYDKITLREFVDNAIQLMGKNEFFIYDSLKSNCQNFVTDILTSNNLWSTKYDLFVNQSINESLDKINGLKGILRKITDVGAITNQIIAGKPKSVSFNPQVITFDASINRNFVNSRGGMKAGTDDIFIANSQEKMDLKAVLDSMNKIDITNLHNRDVTKKAYTVTINALHVLRGILRRRGLDIVADDLSFVNSNRGFSYLASFEEDDKLNKENLKELFRRVHKMIIRILEYKPYSNQVFDSHDRL